MNNKFSKVKFSTPGKFYPMDMTGFLSSNNKKYISFSKESNKSTYKKKWLFKKNT